MNQTPTNNPIPTEPKRNMNHQLSPLGLFLMQENKRITEQYIADLNAGRTPEQIGVERIVEDVENLSFNLNKP